MKINKIALLTLALPMAANANLNFVMPNTTGKLPVGSDIKYIITGEVNYLTGISANTKSGFQNSRFGIRFAEQYSQNINSALSVQIAAKYDADQDYFKETIGGDYSLHMNGHTVKAGYDNWFSKEIFSNIYKSNLDTNFSLNPIGIVIDHQNWFGAYEVAMHNMALSVTVDEELNHHIGVSQHLGIIQADIGTYKYDHEFGTFFNLTTDIAEAVLLTAGMGTIGNEVAYTAASSFVLNSGFSMFGSVIGLDHLALASTGVDYTYSNFTAYIEASTEIGSTKGAPKENKVGAGLKFIF